MSSAPLLTLFDLPIVGGSWRTVSPDSLSLEFLVDHETLGQFRIIAGQLRRTAEIRLTIGSYCCGWFVRDGFCLCGNSAKSPLHALEVSEREGVPLYRDILGWDKYDLLLETHFLERAFYDLEDWFTELGSSPPLEIRVAKSDFLVSLTQFKVIRLGAGTAHEDWVRSLRVSIPSLVGEVGFAGQHGFGIFKAESNNSLESEFVVALKAAKLVRLGKRKRAAKELSELVKAEIEKMPTPPLFFR